MTSLPQISINFFALSTLGECIHNRPINGYSLPMPKIASLDRKRFQFEVYREKLSSFLVWKGKDVILVKEKGWRRKRKRRVVLVRFNQGFGFNGGDGGGGGGGGRDNSSTARLLGNIALAVGLTYLSMTGQLGKVLDAIGWVLDAVISLWLLAVLVPILGLGAFLWWAQRDIIQSTCPNCGNEFQIFKSTLNDELQLCPFCSQPFSVVDDKFVRDSVKFSNQSTEFGRGFSNFSPVSKTGKDTPSAVVDVEAEVKDAD